MPNHETIKNLSVVGSTLIGIQLILASTRPNKISRDPWALGYCFGFLDAIIQVAKLDQYTDGALLMTVALNGIFGGKEDLMKGARIFNIAIDQQVSSVFQSGVIKGGADFMTYRSDTDRVPRGLFSHLTGSN